MSNLNLNFYQILEIDKNATQQEIRQKYLILALKYHPDRNRNLEYSKYLECEEKFKLITKAFHILSDPFERKEYDKNINIKETNFNIFYSYQFENTNFTISSILLNLANKFFTIEQIQSSKDFFDIFSKIYSNNLNNYNNLPNIIKNYKHFSEQKTIEREKEKLLKKTQNKKEPEKEPEKEFENNQEIILKNKKETLNNSFDIDKNQNQNQKEIKSGILDEPLTYNINVSLDDIYNEVKKELNVSRIRVCDFCLGKGYLGCEENMSLCHICNGMLKRIDKKIFTIDIREHKIVFKGEGNQSLEKEPNDLIFNINPKANDKFTIINQYDLLYYHNISLIEVYTGVNVLLTHLDKKQYLIKYEENTNTNRNTNTLINKMSIRVRDLGLPISNSGRRGDLYIKLNIILPNLTDKDIKILGDLKLFNQLENKENLFKNFHNFIKINAEISKINI